MVQFDNQYRQVKLKVVYYGPGLGGKTTCLQYIHRVSDPQRRTKLYSLNTASDRTLFFDLLSLDLGRVRGYRLMLQLYTVPGQVQYNATRRAVLVGADGVVFVADSQKAQAKANEESLANLIENLKVNGLAADSMPIILQYNKRDLPGVMSRAEMDAAFNSRGFPVFETVATTGIGVMEGFASVTEATVVSVADRLGLSNQTEAVNRLITNVRAALAPFVPKVATPIEAPVMLRPTTANEMMGADELVGEAVRANIAMADLNTRLDRLSLDLEKRVSNLRSINEFGRFVAMAREPDEVTTGFVDRLLGELRVACGSLMLVNNANELVPVLRRGLATDPISQRDHEGRSPAALLISSRQPFLARLDELDPAQIEESPWLDEVRGLGLVSVIAVPLIVQDRMIGLATAYADATRGNFEDEELELASVMATNAAVALANARAWLSLEQLNRSLEEAVADRTKELEEALKLSRALGEELEDKNLALESANVRLRELEQLKSDMLNRIAHELNTPVTAIQTAARILTRYEEVPADKAAKFVEIITQEAARLAELISSALQVAVLGVPEGKATKATVGVTDLLRRVLAPVKNDIATRHITVQVKVAAGLDFLVGDLAQLETALRAIVRNAVDFNHDGGALTVTARPARRGAHAMVELRVEDTGVGIPQEDIPQVTEVFWQGGNVLTNKPRGLGLGLAVAKRVVDNHGGILEIVSQVDKGTTVSVFLPSAVGA